MRVLLLGGTTEASQMAAALATAKIDAVFSYAGRTHAPQLQPLPTRVGGFGGADGLKHFLQKDAITHVIDATHPFAASMSRNAARACDEGGVPLLRLERPAWQPEEHDNWTMVPQMGDLPAALPDAPTRVFLAIGRQQIGLFACKPQHRYILRLVDTPDAPLPLPDTGIVIARGPFDVAGDTALMRDHQITHVVAKNAGGRGSEAKLIAARSLGLPVIMADRPALPPAPTVAEVSAAMNWLTHDAERGV